MAQAKWYDNMLDACTGEALACRDAVSLVKTGSPPWTFQFFHFVFPFFFIRKGPADL
jgi:hypothetical protein